MIVSDVVSATLMLAGGLSCLLGALGLVRLPDLPARLQATTKPQTLGLLLILIGVAIRLDFENSSTLVLVMLFQILTAPVISQVVGRSAYRSGAIDRDSLIVDELGDRMEADARAGVRTPDGAGGRGGRDPGVASGADPGVADDPDGSGHAADGRREDPPRGGA